MFFTFSCSFTESITCFLSNSRRPLAFKWILRNTNYLELLRSCATYLNHRHVSLLLTSFTYFYGPLCQCDRLVSRSCCHLVFRPSECLPAISRERDLCSMAASELHLSQVRPFEIDGPYRSTLISHLRLGLSFQIINCHNPFSPIGFLHQESLLILEPYDFLCTVPYYLCIHSLGAL